jgi:hypothetical protein
LSAISLRALVWRVVQLHGVLRDDYLRLMRGRRDLLAVLLLVLNLRHGNRFEPAVDLLLSVLCIESLQFVLGEVVHQPGADRVAENVDGRAEPEWVVMRHVSVVTTRIGQVQKAFPKKEKCKKANCGINLVKDSIARTYF